MGHGISGISWNFKRSIPDIESQGIVHIFCPSHGISMIFVRQLHSVLVRCVMCKQRTQTAATMTHASPELSFSQRLTCA